MKLKGTDQIELPHGHLGTSLNSRLDLLVSASRRRLANKLRVYLEIILLNLFLLIYLNF
jgi:hypothetical protein